MFVGRAVGGVVAFVFEKKSCTWGWGAGGPRRKKVEEKNGGVGGVKEQGDAQIGCVLATIGIQRGEGEGEKEGEWGVCMMQAFYLAHAPAQLGGALGYTQGGRVSPKQHKHGCNTAAKC